MEVTDPEPSEHAVRAVPDVNRRARVRKLRDHDERGERERAGQRGRSGYSDRCDPDDDSLNYTITGGADMDSFGIGLGSGQITVKEGTKLDFEGKTSYEVEVTAMDPFGLSDSTMVTIMVTERERSAHVDPDFEADDPDNYAENGTDPVATFTATDPEGASVDLVPGRVDGRPS